jgi:hypothetical protein
MKEMMIDESAVFLSLCMRIKEIWIWKIERFIYAS